MNQATKRRRSRRFAPAVLTLAPSTQASMYAATQWVRVRSAAGRGTGTATPGSTVGGVVSSVSRVFGIAPRVPGNLMGRKPPRFSTCCTSLTP
jgi:hypothetical protein